MKELRRTGRTTRMLDAAVEVARQGQYVMVYAANQRLADDMAWRLAGYKGASRVGGNKVFFYSDTGSAQGEIAVLSRFEEGDRLDVMTGRVRGVHPNVPVFVDHFLLEQAMGWAFEEWARWSL